MNSLSHDLQEVTDWDDMRLAKLGGKAIHSILDHAYPTKAHYDVSDLDDHPVHNDYSHDIVVNPAHSLLPTSGVAGVL